MNGRMSGQIQPEFQPFPLFKQRELPKTGLVEDDEDMQVEEKGWYRMSRTMNSIRVDIKGEDVETWNL